MPKITLWKPDGQSMDIDDTPQRRAWATGKGYTLDKKPSPAPTPRPASRPPTSE